MAPKKVLTDLDLHAGKHVLFDAGVEGRQGVNYDQLNQRIAALNLGLTQGQVDARIDSKTQGLLDPRGTLSDAAGPLELATGTPPEAGWAYRVTAPCSYQGFEFDIGDIAAYSVEGWYKIDAVDRNIIGTADEIDVAVVGDTVVASLAVAAKAALAQIPVFAQQIISLGQSVAEAMAQAVTADTKVDTAALELLKIRKQNFQVVYEIDASTGSLLKVNGVAVSNGTNPGPVGTVADWFGVPMGFVGDNSWNTCGEIRYRQTPDPSMASWSFSRRDGSPKLQHIRVLQSMQNETGNLYYQEELEAKISYWTAQERSDKTTSSIVTLPKTGLYLVIVG